MNLGSFLEKRMGPQCFYNFIIRSTENSSQLKCQHAWPLFLSKC
jgi:hypothetical protein